MRRFWLLLLPLVAACDPKGASQAEKGTLTASVPELSAPEPARFGTSAPVTNSRVEATLRSASADVATVSEEPAGNADLERAAAVSGRTFDGTAKLTPVSLPVSLPVSAPARAYRGRTITHHAGMSIDTDGRIADRQAYLAYAANDRTRQNQTSLRYRGGRSLDPMRVPYVVLPLGYRGAGLGDLVYVQYKGRGAWAVVGDYGPEDRFGEGSSALASQLGINPSGAHGGVRSGVTYTIYPGTGKRYAAEADLVDHIGSIKAA